MYLFILQVLARYRVIRDVAEGFGQNVDPFLSDTLVGGNDALKVQILAISHSRK